MDIKVPTDDDIFKLRRIKAGFSIRSMNIKYKGKKIWEEKWSKKRTFPKDVTKESLEYDIILPPEILKCESISREVKFFSNEGINHLNIIQNVLIDDSSNQKNLENWVSEVGCVIPQSTNTWEITIEKYKKNVLKKEEIDGKMIIETTFWDEQLFIGKIRFRIYFKESKEHKEVFKKLLKRKKKKFSIF